jgi:hypothetical protein
MLTELPRLMKLAINTLLYKFPLADLLHALSDLIFFVMVGPQISNLWLKLLCIRYYVIYCVCDILQFREGRSVKVFENRVLRRIFRPKRDEVTGVGSLEKTT